MWFTFVANGCSLSVSISTKPTTSNGTTYRKIGTSASLYAEVMMARVPLLHELGFKTAAFALTDDSVPLDDPALNAEERLALVFGTEGDGLAPSTIASCDYRVKIPMDHEVDSLNVAAASAVAFWELRTKWR